MFIFLCCNTESALHRELEFLTLPFNQYLRQSFISRALNGRNSWSQQMSNVKPMIRWWGHQRHQVLMPRSSLFLWTALKLGDRAQRLLNYFFSLKAVFQKCTSPWNQGGHTGLSECLLNSRLQHYVTKIPNVMKTTFCQRGCLL